MGGSNTAITFALYALLVYLGAHYNLAMVTTYILGIGLGFALNRLWTFNDNENPSEAPQDKQKSGRIQFGQYVIVYALIFVVSLAILNLLVQIFSIHPIPSQLVAVGVSTICSYFLQKKWVFS